MGIRAELDDSNESLGKRIRQAKTEKVPYIFVVGDKEIESESISIESRTGQEGTKKVEDTLLMLQEKIKTRA